MLDSPIKIVKTESCVLMCVCVCGGELRKVLKTPSKQLHVGGGENNVENTKHIKNIYQRPKKLTTSWSGY